MPRGKFGKLCLKPPGALTPRVHMGPIVEAAGPRRSAKLPPPCLSKDVPHDRSLRSLSIYVSDSRVFAFSTSVSHLMVSFSFCTLSKSALKATTSSDTDTIPTLAVPALGAVPAILFTAVPVPDAHQTSFTTLALPVPSRCTRPLLATVPVKFCTLSTQLPKNVYVVPLARLNTCSDPNTPPPAPGLIYRYIVLGCGSFVRGRKGNRVDSRPLYINEEITW